VQIQGVCQYIVVKGEEFYHSWRRLNGASFEGCTSGAKKGRCLSQAWCKVGGETVQLRGMCNIAVKGGDCRNEGCTNQVVNGGVCIVHGAKTKRCSHAGCTNGVKNGGVRTLMVQRGSARKGGVCSIHGAEVKRCSHEGCNRCARKGGVCATHMEQKKWRFWRSLLYQNKQQPNTSTK